MTEIAQGLRDRQRHDQLHPQRDGGDRRRLRGRAGPGPGARLRRGRPDRRRQRRRRGGEDGDPRPARLPHAGRRSSEVAYEGIEAIQPDDLAYAKELGLSLKLLGVAERRDGGDQRPRLPLLPLPRPPAGADRGPLQRGHGRGAGDHRGDDVGTRRRRIADRLGGARRRRLDPRRRGAGPRDPDRAADRRRRHLLLLPPPRGRRPARACSPGSPTVLGDNEVSVKSVVQRGIGEDARLVMVVHECLESRFAAARRGARRARRPALAAARRSA